MFTTTQLQGQIRYFKNSIYQLLCFKEENNPTTIGRFLSLKQELAGFGKLCGNPPQIITILSLMETAKIEDSHDQYRKALLDAIGLVDGLSEVFPHD